MFRDEMECQEYAEECPVCGYANADENGNPYFEDDPSFCCAHCRDQYEAHQRFMDEVLYIDYIHEIA